MNGEPLSKDLLLRLFEAARWAPSSSNGQPWRFVYGIQGTEDFTRLFDLLVDANQAWCKRAGALVMVVAKATFDNGNPNRTHAFDTGAAWMSLSLQATQLGLVSHGMAGFDYERAKEAAQVPADHAVQCMIALGHPGAVAELPEKYQAREVPSDRKPLEQLVFEGRFRAG